MDTLQSFPFKIGQDAESKSHTDGYRGAWFRCKVKNISMRGGELWCALEYFDFPGEKVTWTKVYQKDPANRKKLELMVRPGFPHFCRECEIADCQNNSEIAAIINNEWQVGNLVDLWYDSCFWSGKIVAVLDNSKIQVDLLKPPNGEGGSYEADCKDLRPMLSWSIESGWIVPLEKGRKDFNSCVRLKGDCNSTFLTSTSAQDKNHPWKNLVLQDGSVAHMVPELKSNQEKDLKIFHGACSHLSKYIQLDGETNNKKHIWNPEQSNLRVGKAESSASVTANSEGFPNNILCQNWQVRGNELQEVDTSYVYECPGVPNQDLHMTEALMDNDAIEHKRKGISVDNSFPNIARIDINQSMMSNSLSRKTRNSFALSTYKKEQAKVIVDRAKSFCHVRDHLKHKNLAGGNNHLVSVSNQFDMPCNSRNKNSKRNSCRDGDEIESSVMVLEELANKVKWLKGVVQFGFNQQSVIAGSSWQFAENQKTNKEVNYK
ncbi:uncharacterized protein LOC131048618 isoform X2 [Cryptomeria japonica]|uniref:uncharacterized protein LOC131048618 isoform X2 n=1 Tax=Cryptomeria japonica TaxID=3369 RepID=UPI0027DA3DE2|nr:uncharacterized protein LOC131048618 isoform X2 [Cryptomeria japonica]